MSDTAKTAMGGCPVFPNYDPLEPAELNDPFPSYARARHEVPVYYVEDAGYWEVTRRDDILAVMRDVESYSNSKMMPIPDPPQELRDRMPYFPVVRAVAFLDEPEHKPARQQLQAPFTPKRLRTMEPLIRENAERLLRPDDPDRHLEFVSGFGTPLAIVVISDLIGVPVEDFPLVQRAINGMFRMASGALEPDEFLSLSHDQLEYIDYLRGIVERRRTHPTGDFGSYLANYVNDDGTKPTTDEIVNQLNTILGAGFETSAQMMAFGMQSILQHRDQWELLKSDRSLLRRAVEECVRHRGIIKRLYRVVLRDVVVGGQEIPAGSIVSLVTQSGNRDGDYYRRDPDDFDITRKEDNLSFGRGLHFCLGAPLAKLEMKITLDTLMDLAPDVRLVDQDFTYRRDMRQDTIEALHLDLGSVPAGARRVTAAA